MSGSNSNLAPVQNNGAQFAMISLASIQNSKLSSEFICEIDSTNCKETITYFQQAQNYTSSFACFTQKLQAQGPTSFQPNVGGDAVFNISRVGDVLLGLTAVISLPRFATAKLEDDGDNGKTWKADNNAQYSGTGPGVATTPVQCGWVENIGHHVINKCELLAQDTVIESFGSGGSGNGVYGVFMDCIKAMEVSAGKSDLYSTMIGNRTELIGLRVHDTSDAPQKAPAQIMCPLSLSFCAKNDNGVPAAPLPVCALAYCTLQVRIGLNSAGNIVNVFHSDGVGVSESVVDAASGVKDVSSLFVNGDQYQIDMLAEYAMVSSQERAALACAQTTQHVLHKQSLVKNVTQSDSNQVITNVTFSGCNAFWWSIFQNQGIGNAEADATAQKSKGLLYNSNYTTSYNFIKAPAGLTANALQAVGKIPTLYSSTQATIDTPGTGAPVHPHNPVRSIKVNADSSPIIDYSDIMTAWYSWWWKTNNDGGDKLATGMNLIPFCLTTEFYSIEANGGFLNLSKLTNISEDVTLRAPGSFAPTAAEPNPADTQDVNGNGSETATKGTFLQSYIHYLLSVSYNSIVVSGGTLQHPYY